MPCLRTGALRPVRPEVPNSRGSYCRERAKPRASARRWENLGRTGRVESILARFDATIADGARREARRLSHRRTIGRAVVQEVSSRVTANDHDTPGPVVRGRKITAAKVLRRAMLFARALGFVFLVYFVPDVLQELLGLLR